MSADSLFKTKPTVNQGGLFSFSTTPNNVIDSRSNTTLFNSNSSTAIGENGSSLPSTTTTTINKSKDISDIPPAFFIAIPEVERTTPIEQKVKENRSLSIGYGDRRLSGILSTELPSSSKKKEETILEIPKKRSNGGIADPSRGLFGDGQVIKRSRDKPIEERVEIEETVKTSNTIKVFGYPTNLTNNVVQHFVEYGKIEKYEQAPSGNWVLITYENNASALAALKSNGIMISKGYLIGVVLHDSPSKGVVTQHVIPAEEATSIFKPIYVNGLGSGKAGVSATNTPNDQPIDGGFFSYIKESIFGW